ncbi:MAG: hypothetical protein AB1697_07240 [Pseudomonadota bacterium]
MFPTEIGSYLEVQRDIYNQGIDPWRTLLELADKARLLDRLDWVRVSQVLRAADGIAHRVGPSAEQPGKALP